MIVSWRGLAACVVAAGILIGVLPRSVQADDFGVPNQPTGVEASLVGGGVRVSWQPVESSPPVRHYIVHAGQGSCPVMVPASATSAVMPVVAGQKVIRPQVQAVNAEGYSVSASSPKSVDVRGMASRRYQNVQLLSFSDFHGAVEDQGPSIGAALLAAAFARDRAKVPATVTISAGDQLGASPVLSAQFDDLPTVQALNMMGLQAATTGNHEHDQPLAHLRQMIGASDFQWVVSNYSTLKPLSSSRKKVDDFTIINAGGVKVGVVGMNTEGTAGSTPPGSLNYGPGGRKHIVISAQVRPVNHSAAAARAAGADVVIGALHQGWSANVDGQPMGRLIDVVRELRGVDVALGGHSHQTFASIVNGIPVAQTRNSGIEYARTQICVDKSSDRVVGSAVEYIREENLAGVKPDARVLALLNDYKKRLSDRLDVAIGKVDSVFPSGGNPSIERSAESPLGTYLAEAMRSKYGTDIGFFNGGGLRDTLDRKSVV